MRRWSLWWALPLTMNLGLSLVVVDRVEPEGETAAAPESHGPAISYTLRQGRDLFLHYCATCHGVEGRGDGFNAYSLDPKPRDLTDPDFHGERTDEDLAAIIRTGGGAVGLSTAMPPWGRTLNDRQIAQLVAFVRMLPELREEEAESE